ncbi:MAG: hypothetical protein HC777_01400 [Hyphomonadaceae bacterium]|nr:hypothetical protein [Hyphomonadaceae bacterium]
MFAGPAIAQSGPSGPSAGSAATVQYDVELNVAPRCGWASGGQPAARVDLGSLDIAGSKDVPFALDCNTPFVIRVSSLNGGLVNDGTSSIDFPTSFTDLVNYDLRMRLGVRRLNGDTDTRTRDCNSAQVWQLVLAANCDFGGTAIGEGWSSNNAVANANDPGLPASRLRLSWSERTRGAPTRVAGSYSDVLTVSVEAQS